ncbi:hypothetical protein D5018_21170, partial [Parashewanella curva]
SQATEGAINYVAKSIPVETATSTGSSDKPDVVTDNNSDVSYDTPEMASSINITSPAQDAGLNASDVDSLIDKLQQRADRPPIQANDPVENLYAAGSKQQITSRRLMGVTEDYGKGAFKESQFAARKSLLSASKTVSKRSPCVTCYSMSATPDRVWYASYSSPLQSCTQGQVQLEVNVDYAYGFPIHTAVNYFKVKNATCYASVRLTHFVANPNYLAQNAIYLKFTGDSFYSLGSCCDGGIGLKLVDVCSQGILFNTQYGAEPLNISTPSTPSCVPPDDVAYHCKATESNDLIDGPQSVSYLNASYNDARAKSGINNAIYAPSRHIVMSDGGYRQASFGALRDRLIAQGHTGINCASGLPQQQTINTDFISYNDLLLALNHDDTPLSPRICNDQSAMPNPWGAAVSLTDIANQFASVSNPIQFTSTLLVAYGNQYTNWQNMETQLNAASYNGEKLYATNGCVSAANRWRGLSMSVLQTAFNGAGKVAGISSTDCTLRIEEPNLTPINGTVSLIAVAEAYAAQSPYYGQVGVRLVSTEYVQYGNAYVRFSLLSGALPIGKRCTQLPAQQLGVADAYKALTENDLSYAFTQSCKAFNRFSKTEKLSFHLPIRATPLSSIISNPKRNFIQLTGSEPFNLLSHNGKVVYLSDLLATTRTLYPQVNSFCGDNSQLPFKLASISQSALLSAFNATPSAPQQCSNSISPRKFGNVVTLQSVADTSNNSPSFKLEPTDIVYSTESHDGVTWCNLTAHFTNNTLIYNSCADDEFAFRNISADEIAQAHAAAPIATPVELGDCSQGVEVVTENDILPLAAAVADATRGFGNNGVTG